MSYLFLTGISSIHLDSSILSSGIGIVLIPSLAALSRKSGQDELAKCEEIVFFGSLPELSNHLQPFDIEISSAIAISEFCKAFEDLSVQLNVKGIYDRRLGENVAPRIVLLQKVSIMFDS